MKIFTYSLFITLFGISCLKAQTSRSGGTFSRLIATSEYLFHNTDTAYQTDSSQYTYTGTNGGDLTSTLIRYSTLTSFIYDTQSDTFANSTLTSQTFDGNDSLISQTIQKWNKGHWVNDQRVLYNYNLSHNDTLILTQYWNTKNSKWYNYLRTLYAYKNNYLDTQTNDEYDTTAKIWDKITKYINIYNGNILINQIDKHWSYNDTGYAVVQLITYQYDANGNDTTQLFQSSSSPGVYKNSDKTDFVYNPNKTIKFYATLIWNTSLWDSVSKYNYYYASNSTIDSMVQQYYSSGWESTVDNIYKYNTYNQAIKDSINDNYGSYIPEANYYYYYETYSGINTVVNTINTIQLYPNPTSNFIHLSVLLQQTQPVQLSLFNILGQQVWGADIGIAKHIEATIPVTNLVNGIYVLRVNAGGTTQQREVVVTR